MKGKRPRDFTRKSSFVISAILWLVVPVATAQLASSPWPLFHHDLNHTGLSPYHGPNTTTLKWIFPAEDGTIFIDTTGWDWYTHSRLYAIASDGTLYIGTCSTCGGKLYAFDVNMPPVLNPIGTRIVDEGFALNITITASDLDGDVLTFSNNASFGAFTPINSTATLWSWTPSYDDAGTYYIDFGVSDIKGGTDNETVRITVNNNTNTAPVLEEIGDRSVSENSMLAFAISATDPDGDALTYSASSNLPPGATFDPSTRKFAWTPAFEQASIYPDMHFAITDGELTDFEDIPITITVRGISVQIAVEPENITVQPQDQFDVNITVDPCGNSVYGIQICLRYNISVLRPETQTKGPLLGNIGETIVITNSIDHTNGIISYAETRKGDIGGVTLPGTLVTIHFTALQQGANTNLNLSNVIAVDDNATRIEPVNIINGTVQICENMHRSRNLGSDGYEPFNDILTVEDNGESVLDNSTSFPVNVFIAGDANGDGVVDIFDAVIDGANWEHVAW